MVCEIFRANIFSFLLLEKKKFLRVRNFVSGFSHERVLLFLCQ